MKHREPWGLILFLAGLTGCEKSSPDHPSSPAAVADSSLASHPADLPGVRTTAVKLRPIADYLEVPARIEADPTRVVRVFAPLGGRLTSLTVHPSDRVRRGQTLAILDSAEVGAARADYLKARVDAEVKEKALKRASLLYENQVLAEKEYQQTRADAEMAGAGLEQARARLRILGVSPEGDSSQLKVTAPRDGVVLDIGATTGELSKSLDSATPLCTLADLSTVWAVGQLYEKDLAGLPREAAAEVRVNAYPSEKWTGRVAAISDTVDPVTRTLKLRVVLPNPGGHLKPDMFSTIRVLRSESQGIAVPASAVLRQGAMSYVFVEENASRFERRTVSVGWNLDGEVEITAGLKPGDVVVVEGAPLLR